MQVRDFLKDTRLTKEEKVSLWRNTVEEMAAQDSGYSAFAIAPTYDGISGLEASVRRLERLADKQELEHFMAQIEKTQEKLLTQSEQEITLAKEKEQQEELQAKKEAEEAALIKEKEQQEERIREQERKEFINQEEQEMNLRQMRLDAEMSEQQKEKEDLSRLRQDAAALERIHEREEDRLRRKEINAARDISQHDFVDDVISMGSFLAAAVRDFYNDTRQAVIEKVEEVQLALNEERSVQEQTQINSYIEMWPENSWQRELAKELVNEGDAKTTQQLKERMEECISFANNTTVAELAEYIDNGKYSATWQSRFISDLAEKSPNQTMSDALTMTMQHDRIREQNPELARQEDMRALIHQIDKDISNPELSQSDIENLLERRERIEKSIEGIDKDIKEAKEIEQARDAFEQKEKADEERYYQFSEQQHEVIEAVEKIDVNMSYGDVRDEIYKIEDQVRAFIPDEKDGYDKNIEEYKEFYDKMMICLDEKQSELHDISVEKAKSGDLDALKGLEEEFAIAKRLKSENLLSKEEYQVVKEDFEAISKEYEKTTHSFNSERQSIRKSEEWTPEQVKDHRDLQEQRERCGHYADMATGVIDYAKSRDMTDQDFIRLGIARNEDEQKKIEQAAMKSIKNSVSDKTGLEIKVHWTKVEGYQVAYDVELSTGEKSNHNYNTFTLETTRTEAIRTFNETLERNREQDHGLSRA